MLTTLPDHRDPRPVRIPVDGAALAGALTIPLGCRGVVIFAHGSGSSRLSPRNQYIASVLVHAGFGTLLFDLLTPEEAERREAVFDIELLAQRLIAATRWLHREPGTASLPAGYFGASTGAAAALVASVQAGREIAAVVSRGGRPDLANGWLERVTAPTLLIVGGRDDEVIELNRNALARLGATAELMIVPGATHLFGEPGTLEDVARIAAAWFGRYLDGLGPVVPAAAAPRVRRRRAVSRAP